MICRSRPEILPQERSTKHAWCAHLVLFLLLNTVQQNLLKAMLNNPEKTSTAWSKLPESSNQSYLASKYIPRLIELSRYLLFIVVSSAKLFLREPEIGTSSWLVLSPVFGRLLFKSPFFAVIISFRHYFDSFPLQGNCSLLLPFFFLWTLLCVLFVQ